MSAQPAPPAGRRTVWSAAARLAPLLDPAIAAVAVALSLVSLLSTDVSAVDPRLEDANALAVVATVVAAAIDDASRHHSDEYVPGLHLVSK
jgi:hypothetical protein